MLREVALAAGLILGGVEAAQCACPGQTGKPIYTDDFSDASGGWDPDPSISFVPGALQIKTNGKTMSGYALNLTFNSVDGDYCVVAAFPSEPPPSGSVDYSSLIILAKDYQNYYRMQISSSNIVNIYRLQAGTYANIFHAENLAAIKSKPGDENALRIVVKNQKLTFFVNATQVTAIRAPTPDANNRFGFTAGETGSVTSISSVVKGRVYPIKFYSVTEAP